MSTERVPDLYRELALHRVGEAIDKLRASPTDRLAAQSAEALEEAAAALACMTALYTSPGGTLDRPLAGADRPADRRRREPRAARRLQPPLAAPPTTTDKENRCPTLIPARYRDADGVWHTLEVRQTPDGAWEVIDRAGEQTRVVDTLAGFGDGRPEAEALARDYAATHHPHRQRNEISAPIWRSKSEAFGPRPGTYPVKGEIRTKTQPDPLPADRDTRGGPGTSSKDARTAPQGRHADGRELQRKGVEPGPRADQASTRPDPVLPAERRRAGHRSHARRADATQPDARLQLRAVLQGPQPPGGGWTGAMPIASETVGGDADDARLRHR